VVVANKMYSTMVTCLSEELTRIGLALRHLAPVEGIAKAKSMYKVQYATCDVRRAICVAVSLVAASVPFKKRVLRRSVLSLRLAATASASKGTLKFPLVR
jgi:hypothetical protein